MRREGCHHSSMKFVHYLPLNLQVPGTQLTPQSLVKLKRPSGTRSFYKCRCRCGATVFALPYDLARGQTRSCFRCGRISAGKRLKVYGYRTPEGTAAYDAYTRCKNPKCKAFPQYGSRGIQFRFLSVAHMAQWLSKHLPKPRRGLLLDRINNDGHYEAGNLRWATPKQSAQNRRSRHAGRVG